MIPIERAQGAVIGLAVGDALGAPFEFGPAGACGAAPEMTGGGHFDWGPGEFTDDTQMAIMQAESLLACDGFDGADLFARFRQWMSCAKDVGMQTRDVLCSGEPWDHAANAHFKRTGRAAGNGSLMRSAPSAVWAAVRLSEADNLALAHTLSAVTHGDPAAGWGTALYHAMLAAALRGDDPWHALDTHLARLPDTQARYRTMLARGWEPAQERTLPNGTVWTCLAQACWAVRRARRYEEAVIAAIQLGGDTDTVAAVAGGLAGALYGAAEIPERWTAPLHGFVSTADSRTTYRLPELLALSARLLHHHR